MFAASRAFVCLAALLSVAPQMLRAQTAAQQDTAPIKGAALLPSPILTIDRERLYKETLYGKAVEARFKSDSDELIAENLRLEQALEAEERDLTDRRAKLPPEEFRKLAAAFDAKAEQIRAAQQSKSQAISRKREADQQRFLEAAFPVIGDLMAASGAVAILDKQNVIVSLRAIDVTDAAIARLDTVLGTGGATPAPSPQASPEPAPSPAP